jgi:hypothetical protein
VVIVRIAYVVVAALMVIFKVVAPGLFLDALRLVSVVYFSDDPEGETPALFQQLFGGSVIG